MGLAIFEQSGSFDPTMYGLQTGDLVQVIAVGGGGGGGGGGLSGSSGSSNYGGDAGEGGYTIRNSDSTRARSVNCGGAGRGYGAGGGGGSGTGSSGEGNIYAGSGGNGGTIIKASIILSAADPIPITIGAGGAGGEPGQDGAAGGTTSFGSYLTAEGGAGGKYNDQPIDGPNRGGRIEIGLYNGAGGGGGGGYLPGEHIFGGVGGSASTTSAAAFTGSGSGGCSGGTMNPLTVIPGGSFGCLPGMDGGPGSGVVIVTW